MSPRINSRSIPMLKRYEANEITGCWLWLGHVSKDGYARAGKHNAHRVFYSELVGPVPDGYDVDHLCKRRDCVNPQHLEAVTEAENNLRKTRTVTLSGQNFDLCRQGHLITGRNIRTVRKNGKEYKRCWVCTSKSTSDTPYAPTAKALAAAMADATRGVS